MQQQERRDFDVWIHRREGSLAGAVAAHLAELSNADLQQVPFFCDVMVDQRSILYDLIDADAVSLAWRASPHEPVYREPRNHEHRFCSTFIYVLNRLDPYPAQNLAHESPYRSAWSALSRRDRLSILVAHFVSQHAAESLLHDLIQDELIDPDKLF